MKNHVFKTNSLFHSLWHRANISFFLMVTSFRNNSFFLTVKRMPLHQAMLHKLCVSVYKLFLVKHTRFSFRLIWLLHFFTFLFVFFFCLFLGNSCSFTNALSYIMLLLLPFLSCFRNFSVPYAVLTFISLYICLCVYFLFVCVYNAAYCFISLCYLLHFSCLFPFFVYK